MKLDYVIESLRKSLSACEYLLEESSEQNNHTSIYYYSKIVKQQKLAIEILEKYDGNN